MRTRTIIICLLSICALGACRGNKDCDPKSCAVFTSKVPKEYGLSGIAPAGKDAYLAVNDIKNSKKKYYDMKRFVFLKREGGRIVSELRDYLLAEPDEGKYYRPSDLEGLTAIPGRPGEFIALESRGCIYHLNTAAPNAKLKALGRLQYCEGYFKGISSKSYRQCEALALHAAGKDLLLAWATRGDETRDSILAWSRLSYGQLTRPGKCKPGARRELPATKTMRLRVSNFADDIKADPAHRQKDGEKYIRHVSDLALDARGNLFATAAYDPGEDASKRDRGPFAASLYRLGRFTFPDDRTTIWRMDFHEVERRGLAAAPCYKYEALTISPDGKRFVLGSDDEDFGGCMRFHDIPGAYLPQ